MASQSMTGASMPVILLSVTSFPGMLLAAPLAFLLNPAAAFGTSALPRQVPPPFRAAVARLKRVTQVPIVIPTNITGKFYCYINYADKNEYEVDLDLTPTAHGDGMSSFAYVSSKKATTVRAYGTYTNEFGPDERAAAQPVQLMRGIQGYYVPSERGKDMLFWNQAGYSDLVAWKASKPDLIQMANSAILNER